MEGHTVIFFFFFLWMFLLCLNSEYNHLGKYIKNSKTQKFVSVLCNIDMEVLYFFFFSQWKVGNVKYRNRPGYDAKGANL